MRCSCCGKLCWKMKKVDALIYGFGPYDGFEENLSEAVVSALKVRRGLITKVFDTRFDRSMLLRPLKDYSPKVIIGLGQHPRARKLRLERKAVNRWAKRDGVLKPILGSGPDSYYANFKLPHTRHTTRTYDAGTYVCNFSMYVYLDYCKNTETKFAYIHIPRSFAVSRVVRYLENALFTVGR